MYVYSKISLTSSQNEKSFKVLQKIKEHFSCSVILSENRAIYEIIWKNMIETEGQYNVAQKRYDLHAG
jgi:hypothetical protein